MWHARQKKTAFNSFANNPRSSKDGRSATAISVARHNILYTAPRLQVAAVLLCARHCKLTSYRHQASSPERRSLTSLAHLPGHPQRDLHNKQEHARCAALARCPLHLLAVTRCRCLSSLTRFVAPFPLIFQRKSFPLNGRHTHVRRSRWPAAI